MQSIEKLVAKYYRTEEKQRRILEVIHLKLDNLHLLGEMFSSYSKLYLYDMGKNEESNFDSDYLLVHQLEDRILHLGIIKLNAKSKNLCQCNSFMTTYKKDKNSDAYFCNLQYCYEINKIVREEKVSKRAETIYQSKDAESREYSGIVKMLEAANLSTDEKLVKAIYRLNVKFGCYHTIEMLRDTEALLNKCTDKREEALVKAFMKEAQKAKTE